MSIEKQRGAKTLTLSLRLDPKTKFILDFIARIKGQSITTVVERAIKETANDLALGHRAQFKWSDFWDPSDGVRTLKLLANPFYPTSFDEDELRAFTIAHNDFFYIAQDQPNRGHLEILWPRIEQYLEIWRKKKSADYWAAGKAMKADLAAARVAGPSWPPPNVKASTTGVRGLPSNLDDEIPF